MRLAVTDEGRQEEQHVAVQARWHLPSSIHFRFPISFLLLVRSQFEIL
jgi:hypothetical protein